MFCANCGEKVEGKFCSKCGAPIGGETNTTNVPSTAPVKKKSHVGLILGIIFGVIFLFIIGIVVVVLLIFKGVKGTYNNLVCESKEGNITLIYNDDELIGYSATGGITYDLDQQKTLFNKYGAESYMDQFNEWFENNTSGTCRKVENVPAKESTIKEENDQKTPKVETKDNTKKATTKVDTKVVGEEKYGYVEVPTKWVTFHDVEGGHQIQYSYGTTYIVTIDYAENPAMTAKAAADSFYKKELEDEDVTNVTSKTTTVGKQKYTAYKVSMYYPNDAVHLHTYWFDIPGDPNLHYLAIEGPSDVEDYNYILDSYTLTK